MKQNWSALNISFSGRIGGLSWSYPSISDLILPPLVVSFPHSGIKLMLFYNILSHRRRSVIVIVEDSMLCIGIAQKFTTCNKHPGRELASLGYHSKDGKILYDGRSQANTQGHMFTEGKFTV